MSLQAMSWAYKQDLKSSAKFLLVTMANYARDNGICWPSISALVKDTGLDRKTVIANLKKLSELGLIVDTGERSGATMSICVYQLAINSDKNGNEAVPNFREAVPEPEQLSSTNLDASSTKNGTTKQSQFSHEAVPNFREAVPNFPEAVPIFSTEPLEPLRTVIGTDNNTAREDFGVSENPVSVSGAISVFCRSQGINANPGPKLKQLIEQGATMAHFVEAIPIAKQAGKGFSYLLGIVKNMLNDPPKARASPAKPSVSSKFDPVAYVNQGRIQHDPSIIDI